MGLFDQAANFLSNLLGGSDKTGGNPNTGQAELPGGLPGNPMPGGIIDQARNQPGLEYRRMFNPTGATGTAGTPEVVATEEVVTPGAPADGGAPVIGSGGGGGAKIITDPTKTGRYTAQGKDLGYNPLKIETGEENFDKDLYGKLLQMYGQPISNQDYYPLDNNINKGNVSVGDMSATVFAGSLGVPPMAAIDKLKMRKELRSAMDDMIAKRNEEIDLGFIPPEVRQAAIMPQVGQMFEQDSNNLISELQSEYGSDWRRRANQDPRTWKFVNKWRAVETGLKQVYDAGQAYRKLAQENIKEGNKGYFPKEALEAADWVISGVNKMAQGLPVDPEELAKYSDKFVVWSNFDTHMNDVLRNKDLLTSYVESIPKAVEIKVAQDPTGSADPEYTEYKKKYGEFKNGYNGYLIEKQVKKISEETARATVESWVDSSGDSWKQLKRDDKESKESVMNRAIKDFQNRLGKVIDNEVKGYLPKGNMNINVTSTSGNKDSRGIYQNTVNAIDKITEYIRKNLATMGPEKVLQEASKFGDASGSFRADKDYFGFKLPGTWGLANKPTTPERFSGYVVPDGNNISMMKPYTAKDALSSSFTGDIPENMTPTSSKIKDVVLAYGVPDENSAGGYKVITMKQAKERGLPDNAEMIALQQEELIFDKDEYEKIDPKFAKFMAPKKLGEVKVSRTAYKIFPATEQLMRQYDQEVSTAERSNSPAGQGVPAQTNVRVSGSTDFGNLEE